MTSATKTKRPDLKPKLPAGAAAVLAHLQRSGDSIGGLIEGGRHYWLFARSGLPVRPSDVQRLKGAGLIEPFGASLDPDAPACYVLTGNGALSAAQPVTAAECGAASIQECAGPGLCLDCAPADMVSRIRSGETALPKIWKGARP